MRFRTRANNEVHIQQGGGRVTIDTDCDDNLFDYAKLNILLPDKTRLLGYGHPSKGRIRLTIETEDDIELGQIGKITAKLEFGDSREAKDRIERLSVCTQLQYPLRPRRNYG
jgi:hypothetical protein